MNDHSTRIAVTAIREGFIKGVKTGLMLLKVMLPIYVVVVFLKYTPVMPLLQEALTPVMKIFGLPGDAAVPIVTGIFADEYGIVAAMRGFDFTAASLTTIAMIGLCFHSMPVETAIGRQIGYHPLRYFLFRLCMAIVTGLLVGALAGALL
jgi:hypothetical protein